MVADVYQVADHKCVVCGASLTGAHRRKCAKHTEDTESQSWNCFWCGKESWKKRRIKNGVREVCCSRACGAKWAAFKRKPKTWLEGLIAKWTPRVKKCVDCGKEKSGQTGERCTECGKKHSYMKQRSERNTAYVPKDLKHGQCVICGCDLSWKRAVKLQCGRCSRALHRGSHRKRARARGATIERFCKIEIFVRDHWRCQGCGVRVKQTMSWKPYQATLDHIIPLSRGGSHTRLNAQTLCQRCNSMKSASIDGPTQQRLFG